MSARIGQRLGSTLLTLVIVSLVIFACTSLLPGDAATAILGQEASPDAVQALRSALGLDHPVPERYVRWISGLAHGDLGTSLKHQVPVSSLIGDRLRNTLLLATLAVLIATPIVLAGGIVSALRRGSTTDSAINGAAMVALSLPEFVVGALLILTLALKLHLFNATTTATAGAPLGQMIGAVWLPALTLVIAWAPYLIRLLRTSLIDALASDHVQMATLKGLSRRRVVLRHALPGALAPTIGAAGLAIGSMIGGVVVVESVFNYPGVGVLMVDAVGNRDIPVIQAVAMLAAVGWMAISLLADAAARRVNPRLAGRTA